MPEYFSGFVKFVFNKNINFNEKILAHIDDDERKETLEEHSGLCVKYLELLTNKKNLDNIFNNLFNIFFEEKTGTDILLFKSMIYHMILLHDMGKINVNFQVDKMKNDYFKKFISLECNNTNHSMLSAMIYINEFFEQAMKYIKKTNNFNVFIALLLNAYVISKHHGNFDSFDEFAGKMISPDGEMTKLYEEQGNIFNKIYEKIILYNKPKGNLKKIIKTKNNKIKENIKKNSEVSIQYYIYTKFMASLLLSCDYYATTEFKNGKEVNDFGQINDVDKYYDVYKNNKIYKSIKDYKDTQYNKIIDFSKIININVLRNEMFLDAEKNLLKNINKNIFFLEAPTGSGKSMVSFNLAFQLLKNSNNLNKIFYIYPFNTLVEQNKNTLNEIFEEYDLQKDISIINSLVPIREEKYQEDGDVLNEKNTNYVQALLDRQFLHYPFILTTHVSMFRFLFSTNKEALFPLVQIANSVLIFDEIQSYKNSIWKEIITFLNHYSKILNIKIIIMSATLPNLCKLSNTDVDHVDLIVDTDKFYQNPIFKNRVKPDYSLLEHKENILEELENNISEAAKTEGVNILIEFITKRSAKEFYEKLKNSGHISNKTIRLLTGEDSSYERNKIVEEFKKNKNIILVATQIIEAGVDLDADVGYKDISMIDSEEQFAGRVNRNFKNIDKQGIMYFFKLDDACVIYKGDVRKEKHYTLENETMRKIYEDKNFKEYYEKIMNHLNKEDNEFVNFFENSLNNLDFKGVENHMNLIDSNYEYSVFFNRTLKISENKVLAGEEVWNKYIKLLEDNELDYSEKRVKLFNASTDLSHFIYKVKNTGFAYEKRIGDLFYIHDSEQYFKDGKFNRQAFDGPSFI